jgi:hypothetical protein
MGDFFSDVYKFLCHVPQIVSACGELNGAVVKSSNIYKFLLGEMDTFSKTRNKSGCQKGNWAQKCDVCEL